MLFQEFAEYLQRIEETPSRNEMTVLLADLINEISKEEAKEVVYLLQGRVAPVFQPVEFNVAEKMMIRSIALSFGLTEKRVIQEFKEIGDLGLLAEKYRKDSSVKAEKVNIESVFLRLSDIASYSGKGSQDKKIIALRDLFLDLPSLSCRYIARIPIGKMRLGLSAKTVLDVLSWAEVGDKSLRKNVERAYYACSDLGLVVETFKSGGIKALSKLSSRPGTPIFSKLVERIPTTEGIVEKMGAVYAQPKFDGLRCQIHKWEENGIVKVKMFSRNLEDMTLMFPDIVESIKNLKAESFILDSEVIAYNAETEEFMPFQKTMYRKRKYKIGEKAAEIPVSIFAFDVLFLNGRDMMQKPVEERVDALQKLLAVAPQNINMTETILFKDPESLEKYFIENVSEGLEGIIVKRVGSIYEPGTRNFEWVKLKRAMKGHLSDTVDVVIMGYYAGKGRLAKFGIGAILVGVLDQSTNEYVTIAKVGTGIKDSDWTKLKRILSDLETKQKPNSYNVDKLLIPDYWVEPKIVTQIRADEITRSPVHTCARDAEGVGYALRFPRMEIMQRDKLPEDCTTVKEVLNLYKNQLSPK